MPDGGAPVTGVAILGSTGSIGRQTLEVIDSLPDRFEVRGLAAGHATDELHAQLAQYPSARAWSPAGRPAGLPDDRWSDGGLEALVT
ncbi:MAG: hypothetical protein ACXWWO_04750, partial [Candidatus Limnocylindria bacterium]